MDALYGNGVVEALRAWLRTGRGRLILADTAETADDAERLVHGLAGVVRRASIPRAVRASRSAIGGPGWSISARSTATSKW